MAVRLNGNPPFWDGLERDSGDILDYNAAYTASLWVKLRVDAEADMTFFAFMFASFSAWELVGTVDPLTLLVSTNFSFVNSDGSFPLDAWHYVTMRRTAIAGDVDLLIDAVEVASFSLDATGRSAATSMWVGRFSGANFTQMDAGYNRLHQAWLDDAEVAAEMASATAVRTDDLWGDYPFPNDANLLSDVSGNDRHWVSASEFAPTWIDDPELPAAGYDLFGTASFALTAAEMQLKFGYPLSGSAALTLTAAEAQLKAGYPLAGAASVELTVAAMRLRYSTGGTKVMVLRS